MKSVLPVSGGSVYVSMSAVKYCIQYFILFCWCSLIQLNPAVNYVFQSSIVCFTQAFM